MRKVSLVFLIISVIFSVTILGDNISSILSVAKQCEANNVYTRPLVDLLDGEIWATAVYLPLTKSVSKTLNYLGLKNPAGILVITFASTSTEQMGLTIKNISFTVADVSNDLQTYNGKCLYADSNSIVVPNSCKDLTVVSNRRSIILFVRAGVDSFNMEPDVSAKAYALSFYTASSHTLWNVIENKNNKEYAKFLSLSNKNW